MAIKFLVKYDRAVTAQNTGQIDFFISLILLIGVIHFPFHDLRVSDGLNLWRILHCIIYRQNQYNSMNILENLGKQSCSNIATHDFNGPFVTLTAWCLQDRSNFWDKCVHVLEFY